MAKGKVISKVAGKLTGKAAKKTRKKMSKAELEAIAKKKKAPKKAVRKPGGKEGTQANLRFRKNYKAQEGAGLDPETGGSVNVAREIDAGRAGKVTRGSASVTNFIKDQMGMFREPDTRTKAKRNMLREISKAAQAGDEVKEKKLRAAYKKMEDADIAKGEKEEASRRRKISTTLSGRKKPVDKYGMALKEAAEDGIIESEYTEGLTERQMEQVMKAARNARKPIGRRIAESGMEEAKRKPGDSAIGRRSGSRGMASGIRAEDRASIKDPINKRAKGGMAKKRSGYATKTNKGATDYRAGGMVLSVQDRRKKRG